MIRHHLSTSPSLHLCRSQSIKASLCPLLNPDSPYNRNVVQGQGHVAKTSMKMAMTNRGLRTLTGFTALRHSRLFHSGHVGKQLEVGIPEEQVGVASSSEGLLASSFKMVGGNGRHQDVGRDIFQTKILSPSAGETRVFNEVKQVYRIYHGIGGKWENEVVKPSTTEKDCVTNLKQIMKTSGGKGSTIPSSASSYSSTAKEISGSSNPSSTWKTASSSITASAPELSRKRERERERKARIDSTTWEEDESNVQDVDLNIVLDLEKIEHGQVNVGQTASRYAGRPEIDTMCDSRSSSSSKSISIPTSRASSSQSPLASGTKSQLPPKLPTQPHTRSNLQLPRWNWRLRSTSRLSDDAKIYARAAGILTRKWRKTSRRNNLMQGDRWFPEVKGYSERFNRMMNDEQEAEIQAVKERLAKPTTQLVMDGYTADSLYAIWEPRFEFGRPVAKFYKSRNMNMSWNRLDPGATVIISRTKHDVDAVKRKDVWPGQPKAQDLLTGSVVRKDMGSVSVAWEGKIPDLDKGVWRLDLWTSDIVLKRMKMAVRNLNMDPAVQEKETLQPVQAKEATDAPGLHIDSIVDFDNDDEFHSQGASSPVPPPIQRENMLIGTHLRDVILGSFRKPSLSSSSTSSSPVTDAITTPDVMKTSGAFVDDQRLLSWCKRQLVDDRNPIKIPGDPDINLNRSQMRSIALMLSQRASLIQGPPGTGKTRVIVEALHLLKVHFEVPHPILVCAHTNTAVDNLASGLVTKDTGKVRPMKVLRLGALTRIRPDLHESSFDAYMERHPASFKLRAQRKALSQLGKGGADSPEKKDLRSSIFGLERRIMLDILDQVDVVCTTCISSVSRSLEVTDFPVVFIDEASMATEPAALIPLMKGSRHVAIIGDHKQLPPVIVSAKAQEDGLSTSLFERLMREGHVPSVMLDTQYRMHPGISAFPSAVIYDSELKDGTVDPKTGKALHTLRPPMTSYLPQPDYPVSWIVHGCAERTRSRSLENAGEAQICADIVFDLLSSNPELTGSDIGIITSYNAQIARIQHVLHIDRINANAFSEQLGERAAHVQDIEIKTVDGFEGREKKVIIFSAVRNNNDCDIGFMADSRRLNVALTRAKNALIIVGNKDTFENATSTNARHSGSSPMVGAGLWRDLVKYLEKRDAIIEHESYVPMKPGQAGDVDAFVDVESQRIETQDEDEVAVDYATVL